MRWGQGRTLFLIRILFYNSLAFSNKKGPQVEALFFYFIGYEIRFAVPKLCPQFFLLTKQNQTRIKKANYIQVVKN